VVNSSIKPEIPRLAVNKNTNGACENPESSTESASLHPLQ
jgi:hypothetical protein